MIFLVSGTGKKFASSKKVDYVSLKKSRWIGFM